MSISALSAKNLTKTYELGGETIYALRDVSFDVGRGEFVAVMGPSGSGKSTLMHLLGLLDLPEKGEVLIEGKSTRDLSDDDLTHLRRDKLGFVFQSFELIPTLSARENILLPAEVAGKRSESEIRCEKIAAQLGIGERLHHRPNQLSGGQRQRVAIARSLINDPVVILADEPTGNLDSHTSTEVLELLKRGVKENSWTVIMVTHDPKAALYADRIVFLQDGKLSGESRTDANQIHTVIEQFVGV
ncbi:MAG: ABC transporter ATP-binding protein [Trueperaceae bacterium]